MKIKKHQKTINILKQIFQNFIIKIIQIIINQNKIIIHYFIKKYSLLIPISLSNTLISQINNNKIINK